jgi:hypothetical protein
MGVQELRQNVAYGFLGLYALYGLFGIGMVGLLFSFAFGLILLSQNQNIELVVAGTILSGLLFKIVLDSRRKKESFQDSPGVPAAKFPDTLPLGQGQTLTGISERVQQMGKRNVFQPSGVLSSDFAEGFADATPNEQITPNPGTPAMASANSPPSGNSPVPPTANSSPAPAGGATATPQLAAALPSSVAAATQTPPTQAGQPQAGNAGNQVKSGFADPQTDGMFKLGSIPPDAIGGSHIDVGTTLMNAMNALKPDQVKAMTNDTRQLLETQKSLMGMLKDMKPMLQDGKNLMEQFTGMFGTPTAAAPLMVPTAPRQ